MEIWKQSQGCNATYGKLIAAFESVGYQAYAEFVRKLKNVIKIPCGHVSNDSYHQSPSTSPLVPVSPEVRVESLYYLTSVPDDNQCKQEGKIL